MSILMVMILIITAGIWIPLLYLGAGVVFVVVGSIIAAPFYLLGEIIDNITKFINSKQGE
jgi:hypothetical protein